MPAAGKISYKVIAGQALLITFISILKSANTLSSKFEFSPMSSMLDFFD